MYSILLICCMALMALLFRTHCVRAGNIHINPVCGFLVGLTFYVLLPSSVVAYASEDIAEMTAYGYYFTATNATGVMAFTLVLLVAFWVGTHIPHRVSPTRPRPVPTNGAPRRVVGINTSTLLLFGSFALLLVLAWSIRDSLFTGYQESTLENDAIGSAKGTISSLYSMMYVSTCAIVLLQRGAVPRALARAMIVVFVVASVILLSLGARLYVAMALLSLLALRSSLQGGIPVMRLLPYLLGGAAAFGTVGVLRSGSLSDLSSVVLNITLEPLLTSISLYTLVTDNPMILIGKVYMFAGDFQAILPSFLFPGKAGLFERLNDYGFVFEAPLGGFHLYFSSLINFGVLGTVVLAVFGGHALARLSRDPQSLRRSQNLTAIVLTGALVFTVFRDPFFISLVKNVLVMAILVPKVITGMTLYGTATARRLPRPAEGAP